MKWLKYIGLAALAAIGVAAILILGNNGRGTLDWVKREFAVIDAETKAKKLEAELGHKDAVERIKLEHTEKLKELDDEAREEIDRLAGSGAPPGELAKRIIRSTGKKQHSGIM